AVRADAVRLLRLVAVRTFTEPHRLQRVVRPALGRSRLRVASFWIRHLILFEQLSALSLQPSAFSCQLFAFRSLNGASRGSSQSRLQSHEPLFQLIPQ